MLLLKMAVLKLFPKATAKDYCSIASRGTDLSRGFGRHIPGKFLREPDSVPIPLKRGGVLFFHRLNCHSSLPNNSDNIRWSFDLRYNPTGQPTGRSAFPGFVARSRSNPESELHDAEEWADMWYETRSRLSGSDDNPTFHRWKTDDPPLCLNMG